MKLQFDGNQPFQLAAVQAVIDLFDGQPRSNPTYSPLQLQDYGPMFAGQAQAELGVGNHLILDEPRLLQNAPAVQEGNDIEVDDPAAALSAWDVFDGPANMARRCPHFSVEMETGTGTTYVYLRTIRELARRYGFLKFVIVVPRQDTRAWQACRAREPGLGQPRVPRRPGSPLRGTQLSGTLAE